jgi:multidrug resistance efflux pump
MTRENTVSVLQRIQRRYQEIRWTKGKRIAVIAAILVLISVFFLLNGKDSGGVETMTIEPQNYQEKLVAVGQLQLADETTLVSEVTGEVATVGAEEGDIISEGSIIIFINDTDQDYQLEQKKADYENADAQYRHLVDFDYAAAKEDLNSQTSKKEDAQKSYDDASQLYQQGAISESDYQQYKVDYEAALAAWNTSKLKVQSLNESGSLRNASYAQLQSAKSSYEKAQNDQKKYHITVPWDSVLLKAYVNAHDRVQAGDALADIGKAGSYHVVTELDEKYFPYLTKGMNASISLGDPGANKSSEGVVEGITPKINSDTGTFTASIALPAEFPYQASDLTVNIEIVLKEQKDGITIPQQYLIDQSSFVYLYLDGKAVKTQIRYEAGPSSKLIVTEGLKKGDVIILPGNLVHDGASVKISKGAGAS